MSPAPASPFGVFPSRTRSGFGAAFPSLGPKGLRSGWGGGAGRCSGRGRSCPGSPHPGGGAGPPSAAGTASAPLPLLAGRTGSGSPAGRRAARGSRPGRRWLWKPSGSRPTPRGQARPRVGKPGGGSGTAHQGLSAFVPAGAGDRQSDLRGVQSSSAAGTRLVYIAHPGDPVRVTDCWAGQQPRQFCLKLQCKKPTG